MPATLPAARTGTRVHRRTLITCRVGNGRSGLCRRAGPAGRLARNAGLEPELVLNLNELLGVRLAFRANEDVAILIAGTASLRSVADSASLDRRSHGTIFALCPGSGGM